MEKYHFEELDAETRTYLLEARDGDGKGVPGIFAGKENYLPVVGLVLGFCVLIGTVLVTFPPTDPPVQEALLQTAGFVLGGWMIVAALRVWTGGKAGKYAGHFVYADAETLYEATGSVIHVTDLLELREANAVQNFNEGKYKNTSLTLKIGKQRKDLTVHNEERGRQMTVFLNAVAYLRDGGETGVDERMKKLSAEAMGAVAKEVARTGNFPELLADDGGGRRVPRPRRDGRASSGLLAIAVTFIIGALIFVTFRYVNAPLRDEAVFDQIKSLPGRDQPPALRMYLANDDFTAHRADAQKMLDTAYDAAAQNISGDDIAMRNAMMDVFLALKTMRQPVVSITAQEEAPPGGVDRSQAREEELKKILADKWGFKISDRLIVFASPEDKTVPGMVDIRWKFVAIPTGWQVDYTIAFRKTPDDPAILMRSASLPINGPIQGAINQFALEIVKQTVGITGNRPLVIPQDPQDF